MLSKKIKAAQKPIVAQSAELAGSTTETIRNVELVKSLGLEQQEINRLNSVNENILQLELKKVKLIRTLSFIQGTTINALRSGLLLLMLWLVATGIKEGKPEIKSSKYVIPKSYFDMYSEGQLSL
jgi:ATP-binding cassette subfamily B protein